MSKQDVTKTLQNKGSGEPPLIWNLMVWSVAIKEASGLTSAQYWHIADQLKEVARCKEPAKCETATVAPIEEFWELKDKGGVLGKINLRVFFVTHSPGKALVILGVHKKEDEGKLRKSVVMRIQRRLKQFLASVNNKGDSK